MVSDVKIKRRSVALPPSRRARRSKILQDWVYEANDTPDQWLREEPGEEYRYARGRRNRTAAQAYQKSAALKNQRSTHQPFYMEDLGREPDYPTPPPTPSIESPRVTGYQQPTRFYPHSDSDSISPVSRVRPAQSQRVLPNYELSTEETRETGLGPALEYKYYPGISAKKPKP